MTLEDNSPMPFGKYKGRQMSDVPASYLHWFYNAKEENKYTDVGRYISTSIEALKLEDKDLIW